MRALLAWGACRAALLHLVLSLCLQGQSLWWAPATTAVPTSGAGQLGGLLLFQWSGVLAALLLGALVAALLGRGAVRSGLAVSVAAGLLLIADAWAFRVLGEHLSVGFLPFAQTPVFLSSSLLAELDFLLLVDLLLLALGVVWQARAPSRLYSGGRRIVLVAPLVTYLAFSAAAFGFASPPELSWHPLACLVRDLLTPRTPQDGTFDLATALAPPFESQPADPAETARLGAVAAAVGRLVRPNIVLVVLESTGSHQLLIDGKIDPTITPNLARLARHGVLFDQVYTNIPGTAHANLAMSTGGRYPTWENITDLMPYAYTGDVLARSLKQMGYRTALFAGSDLGYLESRRFFAQAGYDLLSDFGQLPPDRQDELRLNSWGGRDDLVAASATAWLDQADSPGQPFFLHFMTNSPHHPYQIPSDFPPLVAGDDARSRYVNALHYADAALGVLIRKIESSGQAEQTVFLVTSDHGAAFNPVSSRAQSHRHGLYEDGVRSFLLISSPAIDDGVRSSRIGNHGDLLPTLLTLAGGKPPTVPGQNLLGDDFQQRTAFFQFGHDSGSWGLRDGRWKYISHRVTAPPELYDLDADPHERVNLAEKEPERVRRYDQLCSIWYFGRNAEYRKFLAGHPAMPSPLATGGASLGLEMLTAGVLVPAGSRTFFAAVRSANPADRIVLETRWRPMPTEQQVVYHWQPPTGKPFVSTQVLHPLAVRQRVFLPGQAPWVAGVWKLTVDVDGRRAGETQIEVTPAVQARAPADYSWPELVSLRVGRDSGNHALPGREIPAGEPIRFESEWNMSDHDRELSYVLIPPSGQGELVPFTVVAHEWRHSFTLTPPRDVELGEWSAVVVYKDKKIEHAKFRIGKHDPSPARRLQ